MMSMYEHEWKRQLMLKARVEINYEDIVLISRYFVCGEILYFNNAT